MSSVLFRGGSVPFPIAILVAVIAYFLTAELGLALATFQKSASPVWPASGLAVAMLVTFGVRLWPAVTLGAFVANALTGGFLSALPIAAGNTLEALIGSWVISHLAQPRFSQFPYVRAASFVAAALAAPLVSAGFGVASLWGTGAITAQVIAPVAITWWTGDALGILAVASALLALSHPRAAGEFTERKLMQATILILAALPAGTLTFLDPSLDAAVFLAFPLILLAGIWFGAIGSTWLAFFIATIWIIGTALGHGPFIDITLNWSLLNMQAMLAALALAGMIFAEAQGKYRATPGLVFLIGCAIGAAIFAVIERQQEQVDDSRFSQIIDDATSNAQDIIRGYVDVLRGGAGFFLGSKSVERAEWHAYVNSLNLERDHPGMLGLGAVIPVLPAELDDFIRRARADGAADFTRKVVPNIDPKDAAFTSSFIILYVEPAEVNAAAIGLDLASEPKRRIAAIMARDSGAPTITSRLTLVQDRQKRAGFLLFVPMAAAPQAGATEGGHDFRGWIYAPFTADSLFGRALHNILPEVHVEIFDGEQTISDNLAYDSSDLAAATPSMMDDVQAKRSTQIILYGHIFTARWSMTTGFHTGGRTTGVLFGAGLLTFSTLLAALIQTLLGLRDNAVALAGGMTTALRASNERFELAVKGSRDGIWDWDLDQQRFWASPRCYEIRGYAATELSDRYEAWESLIVAEDRTVARQQFAALTTGSLESIDFIQQERHRDGRLIYVHTRAVPVRRADGRVTRLIGVHSDITALLEAELRLRAAIDVMDSGFALFDAEDRLVICNEPFIDEGTRARFGNPVGRTFEEIFRGFAHDRFTAVAAMPDPDGWLQWRLEMHRSPPPEPLEIQWTDGRWMRVTERRTAEGGYVGLWTDITAVKRAEQRLRDAIESINESFILLDSKLCLVMFNREALRMYPVSAQAFQVGARMEDVLRYGATHGEYPGISTPEEVETFVRHWMTIYAGSQTFVGEGRLADGRCVLISHHATSDGGFVNVYTDITAQKRREEDLSQAKVDLEAQAKSLKILAGELERLRHIAEEASAGKSRFLANMSHELRTPLNGVLGFSDMIRNEMFGSITPPVYKEYADFIHSGGTHLLSLINDILDLSKIEAGQKELVIEQISVAELIRQSTNLVGVQATQRGVELVLPTETACPIIHGDERAVRQILLNLMSNAVKFTPPGGRVTLTITHAGDAGADLIVADTGIGMTPAELSKALELYGQVKSNWTKDLQGTGLGLPLVKALAELHHGQLAVSSAKGEGTTVSVRLPWSDLFAQPPQVAAGDPSSPSTDAEPLTPETVMSRHEASDDVAETLGLRILVVDDSSLNRRLVSDLLGKLNHQVECVTNGLEAVDRAQAGNLDLILMDIQMPKMGGMEATRQIRASDGPISAIPIVGLTADLDDDNRDQYLQAGMDDVIGKPFDPAKLALFIAERFPAA